MAADEPVTPRPAATIMVVRDAPDEASPDRSAGLEVLLVRRSLKTEFGRGAYVFPGGAVDPADGGGGAPACCRGRSDREASALLGLPSGGLAYWVAALRECFEEAGLLLAYPRWSAVEPEWVEGRDELLALEPGEQADRFRAHRAAVNTGSTTLLEICAAEGLQLAVDRVHYFAHWITPVGAPRRYDTRFFVAPAPAGQEAVHDAGETIAEVWLAPQEALRRHREGQIELIFPTIRNLQAISRFPNRSALLAAAEEASSRVPEIEPRVVSDGNGVRILLPGDPGYDETPLLVPPGSSAATAATDRQAMEEAIKVISRAANQADPADRGDAADPG